MNNLTESSAAVKPRWPSGHRLRGLMRGRGCTPRQLADRSGVGLNTVHAILRGERIPLADTVDTLLAALDSDHAGLRLAPSIAPHADPARYSRTAREFAAVEK